MNDSSKDLVHVPDFYAYRRRKTREVKAGDVGIGGKNPIRIQSMATVLTTDTDASVAQAVRMVQAGCEIVRFTAPAIEDAKNLKNIKRELLAKGIKVPLVADVHFIPAAAMEAAEHVEKVRINPGNYADSKAFKVKEYTDTEYEKELERIEERFTPLVLKLKKLGRALRIGTNHGSLSDRILNRYGDSPEGMVESAFEFVRICRRNDFHDIVLSMKSSNVKVMIAAYRLLAARMMEEKMDYPFHLGVTEAGEGQDGRIKSAVGIGSLLLDGIGDTIRVSLTEDPEFEIPVCRQIIRLVEDRAEPLPVKQARPGDYAENLFHYSKRDSKGTSILGGKNPCRVFSRFDPVPSSNDASSLLQQFASVKRGPVPELVEWTVAGEKDIAALEEVHKKLAGKVSFFGRFEDALGLADRGLPLLKLAAFKYGPNDSPEERKEKFTSFIKKAKEKKVSVMMEASDCKNPEKRAKWGEVTPAQNTLIGLQWCEDAGMSDLVFVFNLSDPCELVHNVRFLAGRFKAEGKNYPIHVRVRPNAGESYDDHRIAASAVIGSLLCDGIGDSVEAGDGKDLKKDLELCYNILQAAGVRITKTEYISCPSCGRTLFDLQSTTEKIRSCTDHLVGVKIAIMGCIVNGPGEMADADFGYVGGAPGRINLYVGKECVEKNLPADTAVDKLIELIKKHHRWTEPA